MMSKFTSNIEIYDFPQQISWKIIDTRYVITNDMFEDIRSDVKQLSIEFNKLLTRNATLQQRVIMLMSSSAQERYLHFLQTYPDLINRVPLKLIASYIGITPEALSNVRKRRE